MAKCMWCGEEHKDSCEWVSPEGRYEICFPCFNLAANDEWDKLLAKLEEKRHGD